MWTIDLDFCQVKHKGDHILTTFQDGASSANWPQRDPEYLRVVADCGFFDPMAYCFEHELLHSLLPLRLFGRPGYVAWMSAHQRQMNLAAAKAEERLIYYVQRFIGDPEFPCPDPQWIPVRDEVLALETRV